MCGLLDNVAVQTYHSPQLPTSAWPHDRLLLPLAAAAYKPRLRIKILQTPGHFHLFIYIDSLYSEPFSDLLGCIATPSAEDSPMAISHRRPFIIDQDTLSNFACTIPTGNDNMVRDEEPIRDGDLCSVPRPRTLLSGNYLMGNRGDTELHLSSTCLRACALPSW